MNTNIQKILDVTVSLIKSKRNNLGPTCQKMVELFKQLDAILQN